jgi:hypothetical protein
MPILSELKTDVELLLLEKALEDASNPRHIFEWHDYIQNWLKPTPENPREIAKRYVARAKGEKWVCEIRAVSADKTVSENIERIIDEHFPKLEAEKESALQLRKDFNELMLKWMDQTGGQSSLTNITSNINYLRIISLGKPVVPLIIEQLKIQPAPWFVALRAITGEMNVGKQFSGNFGKIAQAWIDWYNDDRENK